MDVQPIYDLFVRVAFLSSEIQLQNYRRQSFSLLQKELSESGVNRRLQRVRFLFSIVVLSPIHLILSLGWPGLALS